MATTQMAGAAPDNLFYVGRPTVPAGMTIPEYRRSRARPPSRWQRFRRRLPG